MPETTLDMTNALRLLDDLRERVEALNGAELNVEVPNHKALMSARAATNSALVYSGHLAHLIEVEVISQYHRFKGAEGVPTVQPGQQPRGL